MSKNYAQFLEQKLEQENFAKLSALNSPEIINFVGEYVELCQPKSVFVRTDAQQDINYIREKALSLDEEKKLATAGQTIHFDGPFDQARDKKNTKYLLPKGAQKLYYLNSAEREKGLKVKIESREEKS